MPSVVIASAFVDFESDARTQPLVSVSTGAIIETREQIGDPGLIEIRLNDHPLLAFTRDIQERAELLENAACAVA